MITMSDVKVSRLGEVTVRKTGQKLGQVYFDHFSRMWRIKGTAHPFYLRANAVFELVLRANESEVS